MFSISKQQGNINDVLRKSGYDKSLQRAKKYSNIIGVSTEKTNKS